MANITRLRVVLKDKWNDSYRNFKDLLNDFHNLSQDWGIAHEYRESQRFTSKSEKKRKKVRQAIAKNRQLVIEQKLVSGDPIRASAGMIKRVMAKKKKDKDRERERKRKTSQNNNY